LEFRPSILFLQTDRASSVRQSSFHGTEKIFTRDASEIPLRF
jgi:hypothetical protein